MSTISSPSRLKRASSTSTIHLRPHTELKRLRQDLSEPTTLEELTHEFRGCVDSLFSFNVVGTLKSLQKCGGYVERQAAATELSLTALRNCLRETDDLHFDTGWEEGLALLFDSLQIKTELPPGISALFTRLETLQELITTARLRLSSISSLQSFDDRYPATNASVHPLDDGSGRGLSFDDEVPLPTTSAPVQPSCDGLGQDLPFGPVPQIKTDLSIDNPLQGSLPESKALSPSSIAPNYLRPHSKDGPSIRTLDPAFCLFSVILDSVLPAENERTEDHIDAWRAAFILHGAMGEIYFDDSDDSNYSNSASSIFENPLTASIPRPLSSVYIPFDFQRADRNKRRVAFMYALDGFLPLQWRKDEAILVDQQEGSFDVIFSDDKSYYLGVRIDIEAPVNIDPDMEVRSTYDLFRRSLPQPALPGFPMFLITVVGPRIVIFGAIYDGESTIIEPLVSCMAMRDPYLLLAAPLAQAFYALKMAILNLQDRSKAGASMKPQPKIVPGCPVIFKHFSFELPGQQTEGFNVQYLRPFSFRHRQSSHMFEATQEGVGGLSILVKIPILSRYGRDVHNKLAALGYAPKLLGWSITPVGTAYAMEYLRKPTELEGGWFTLFELARRCCSEAQRLRAPINTRLNDILKALQKNNMVHGDIRSNNVMIKMKDLLHVDDDPELTLLIVDFDWADYELLAYYPPFINREIPWGGKPGGQILFAHDVDLVGKWMATYPTSIRF